MGRNLNTALIAVMSRMRCGPLYEKAPPDKSQKAITDMGPATMAGPLLRNKISSVCIGFPNISPLDFSTFRIP